MAKEEIAFTVSVDTGATLKDVKDLKQQFAEAEDAVFKLAGAGKQNTEEFRKAAKEAAKLKQGVDNINQSLDDLKPEATLGAFSRVGAGAASGFAAAQGAAALLGDESEDLQKTLVKVQSAMALSEGLKGINDLGKGFKVLGAIIKTNPIMLLATILISLGAAAFALKDKIKVIGVVFDAIGDAIGFVIDKIKEFTDWIGISSFAMDEAAKKELDNITKIGNALQSKYDREITLAAAAGKNTAELEKKKQRAIIETAVLEARLMEAAFKRNGELNEEETKRLDELLKIVSDASLALEVIEVKKITEQEKKQKESTKRIKEEHDKRLADEIEFQRKSLEAFIKAANFKKALREKEAAEIAAEIAKNDQADTDRIARNMAKMEADSLAQAELKLLKNQNDLQSQIDFLNVQRDTELAHFEGTESERALIVERYDKQIKDAKEASINAEIDAYQQLGDATMNIANLVFAHQMKQAEGNAIKQRQIAQRQFKVNKALGIVNATIDGIQGVQKALALGPPIGYVLAAVSAVAAAANIAKIASTKFDGGGGASGGGGGVGTVPSAPNIEPPRQGSAQLNADGSVKQNNDTTPTIRAVVVETDVTKVQNKVSSIESNSRL